MTSIRWMTAGAARVFGANQPLTAIVDAAQQEQLDWVILERPKDGGGSNFYAYRPRELWAFAQSHASAARAPAEAALDLDDSLRTPSALVQERPQEWTFELPEIRHPSSLRLIGVDASGRPEVIGEAADWDGVLAPSMGSFFLEASAAAEPPSLGLGERRGRGGSRGAVRVRPRVGGGAAPPRTGGGGASLGPDRSAGGALSAGDLDEPAGRGAAAAGRDEVSFGTRGGGAEGRPAPAANGAGPAPAATTIDAVLSAEAPPELPLGEESIVDVRLEVAGGAAPLAHALAAQPLDPQEEVVVILSVEHRALKVVGPRVLRLAPPSAGRPTVSSFLVVGLRPGVTRVSLMFRQGGSDLGTLSFDVTVVAASARAPVPDGAATETVRASAPAARRERADDEVLVLLIEEEQAGNRIFYGYQANWEPLRWSYKEFQSAFLKAARGSGAAALRYVRTIYQQILDRVLVNHEDLRVFQRELRGIGTDMCRQLFDPEFVRGVWEHRDKLKAVQVITREPFIPWELLRLEHPDTREVDEKFLCEYGLVRSFSGRSAPRDLRAADWRYLVGTYPHETQPPLGSEVDYLTTKLPRRGIVPRAITASAAGLLDVLEEASFDVLHIACHAQTDLRNPERSALIVTDRPDPRRPRKGLPVTVGPTTVRDTARLGTREPIVFLNACETGQQAPSLTDWGGWPRAFWDAGVGAFVGTSWSVYDRPAAVFSEAFYEALLGGSTLAEAAAAGRAAAKAVGDGSWLAYVVYGSPVARISTS